MASTNHDEARIRDYLLGHLSDEEQQQIEERLMVEDDLFDELETSKGELIEEYCANELPQSERRWFMENYLASEEGRQRHAFALALNSLKRSKPAPQPLTWFQRLLALFKTQQLIVATSTALVAIVVCIFIYNQISTTPTSYAFNLNSTAQHRSTGDARYHKVPLSPETGELRITLQLPENVPQGNSYRAELDDRRQITNLNETSHDRNSVVVVVPTKSLRVGLYALKLYAIKADGTEQPVPGEYQFELVNPSRFQSPANQQQSGGGQD